MHQAKLKGISKAAPMVYSNWYTYTALIDGIVKDPFWARYERELRDTDRLFVDFNLHKETAFLITTREKQLLLRNKGSPDNYMRVELAWLELPLPLVKKILG
jgi:hypothetical protein